MFEKIEILNCETKEEVMATKVVKEGGFMGWRGAIRSYNATIRALEKESSKMERDLEKQIKETEKLNLMSFAQAEVESYNERIEQITNMHKDCGEYCDWQAIKSAPKPTVPEVLHEYEKRACDQLAKYQPNFFSEIFGFANKERMRLKNLIEEAKKIDLQMHEEALKNHQQELVEWQDLQTLSKNILQGESYAYNKALRKFNSLAEFKSLGYKVDIQYKSKHCAEIILKINGVEAVPCESKSLLKNGTISVKKLPRSRCFELYQDYVASAVLRISREIFAVLPLNLVLVNALAPIFNSSTGHQENGPVLSVLVEKKILQKLNFNTLDPSDSLFNFVHNVDFKKNRGFVQVPRLSLPLS